MSDLYILQAVTGREHYYIRHAKRLLEIHGLEAHMILPRRRLWIRRQGKRIHMEKPVFPGYVFFSCDQPEVQLQQVLRRTPGFIRFLRRQDGILHPLAESDRKLVSHLISGGDVAGLSKVTFDKNNRIKALSGPLQGYEGHIIKVDRRKQRAKVRFVLHDKTFLIDFQYEHMELAENPNHQDQRPGS